METSVSKVGCKLVFPFLDIDFALLIDSQLLKVSTCDDLVFEFGDNARTSLERVMIESSNLVRTRAQALNV